MVVGIVVWRRASLAEWLVMWCWDAIVVAWVCWGAVVWKEMFMGSWPGSLSGAQDLLSRCCLVRMTVLAGRYVNAEPWCGEQKAINDSCS